MDKVLFNTIMNFSSKRTYDDDKQHRLEQAA